MSELRRVFVVGVAVALSGAACRTVTSDVREKPSPANSASAPTSATSAAPSARAPVPAPAPEASLPWGTRPDPKGPLYPVVDGMCIHGEIWPLTNGALYTYGNGTGAWTRGAATTLARLVDEGLEVDDSIAKTASMSAATLEAWRDIAPFSIEGTWPAPLILYSQDQAGGRMRDWPSLWSHGPDGWTPIASWRDPGQPELGMPVLARGNAVTWRRTYKDSDNYNDDLTFKSFALDRATAAPIPNIASLGRPKATFRRVLANDTSLFAVGIEDGAVPRWFVRILTDGKAREITLPPESDIVAARPTLVVQSSDSTVRRLDGDKLVPIDLKLPAKTRIAAVDVAPAGDVWVLSSANKVYIARASDGFAVVETSLPPPVSPNAHESVQHWPTSGRALAGVAVNDPYAIGEHGALYHHVAGTWQEVELPAPPFATGGRYHAQALVVPAKGDLFVNAGYAEKGVGWKTVERYRAVLRTKRPREVLRCNEPTGGSGSESGRGFMSFPPIANDSCATPFVILLRLGYDVKEKNAVYIYPRTTDYPSVREAIKSTPSLGSQVDLIEVVSGQQRYLGARVPTAAAGKALGESVVKRVKSSPSEVRPEVVCGVPTPERTLHVDAATGDLTSPLPSH